MEKFKTYIRKLRTLLKAKTPESVYWTKRRDEHVASLELGFRDYKYLEMVRKHCSKGYNRYKIIFFYSFPLLIQAKRIVELGSSFTYYPETYHPRSPWEVSSSESEGLVSTRIFLMASRFLNKFGVPATLTSVDIRESSLFDNAKSLLKELDLLKYWEPVMGTDSMGWLKKQTEPIDLALVDSNHTYDQVAGELENLAPLMSSKAAIIIDDAYTLDYTPGVDWCDDETEEGRRKGSEYGAVLQFLEKHPEWVAEWVPPSIVPIALLYKKDSIFDQNIFLNKTDAK